MKNILKNSIYLSLFLALNLVISSCTKDEDFGSDASKVIPLITSLTGESIVFQDNVASYTIGPTRGGSEYIWSVTGAEIQPIEGRTDKVNILFPQYDVPATISVYEVAFNGKSSDPISKEVTVFGTPCDWTLETSDTYGDGWNGALIEVSYGGITTTYRSEGSASNFTIPIPNGIDYTITYISGAWNIENYFKLTSPDGTVWEQGSKDYSSAPTAGLVVGGVMVCP
jgi:hypothetical protein